MICLSKRGKTHSMTPSPPIRLSNFIQIITPCCDHLRGNDSLLYRILRLDEGPQSATVRDFVVWGRPTIHWGSSTSWSFGVLQETSMGK